MSGLTEQERDELFTAVDTYRRKLYVDERPLRNGDPVLVWEAVERIVAERERAAAEKAWDEGVIAWCKNQNGSVIWDLNPYRGGNQ